MTPSERLKPVREGHACFSCLKKACRDHRMATCRRKRQCTEKTNSEQCKYYHHPLLQQGDVDVYAGIAGLRNSETLLPVLTADIIGPE